MSTNERPATLAEIRIKVREALTLLEGARRMMVYPIGQGPVDNEDVHGLALAQYAVGKVLEDLEPEARARRSRKHAGGR